MHGTDASHAAADVLLGDENLASIVDAIRAGRHVLQSSQRTLLYLVAFHLPIVVLAVVAPLAGLPLAVLPIHAGGLGLLALAVTGTVFAAEPVTSGVMRQPPRDARAALLPGAALLRSVASGGMVALGAWAAYAWRLPEVGEPEARAMALIVLLGGNQTLMFAERLALPGLGLGMIPRVRLFWVAWCASALSLGAVLYVPAVARVFSVEPPAAAPTFAALALGVLGVGWRLVAAPPQSPAPADGAR
jgi:Ca2+-transporting ATPase